MKYTTNATTYRFGIMYATDNGGMAETAWYETAEERDDAVDHILDTGILNIQFQDSPLGRMIEVRSFSKLETSGVYFKKAPKNYMCP